MRSILRLALSALLLWAVAAPAQAAISAPVYLGGASDAAGASVSDTITTGTNASAGCMIGVAIIGGSNLAGTVTVTDSAANTYVLSTVYTWSASNNKMYFAYSKNPVALNSGGTIVVAWTTGVARNAIAAVSICGLSTTAPNDIFGAGTATGSGNSDTIATGTLNNANEIVFGVTGLANTTAGYAPGGSFTTLTAPTQGNTSTLLWAYQIVASTSSVTYAPAWTTIRNTGTNVYTFTVPATSPATGGLTTMGCCQ